MKSKVVTLKFDRDKLSNELLTGLYTGMLYPRLIEEKMLKLLRQGKVTKWFSGIGQEAISVGTMMALDQDEMVFPLHRNLGVFTTRMVSLYRLVAQWQGKASGFTNGRDRSFHFGTLEHHIVGMISHLGPQLSLAVGAALACKLRGERKVTLAFTGEGGTSQGEFHEALNLAAVWHLPVIFVIENNGYALSTTTSEQYLCKNLSAKGKGYGIKALKIDGNNVIEVFATTQKLASEMRKNPKPALLECKTFRMRGHEEASGTKYVPDSLLEKWAGRDPLENFENFLLAEGIMDAAFVDSTTKTLKDHIESEVSRAFADADVISTEVKELNNVFANSGESRLHILNGDLGNRELRFVDAIREALDQSMQLNDHLILMGQDIAQYGGVFKVTEGLYEKYGGNRVRNTPLCESAVIGAAVGLSLCGYRAMVEMQFSDFVSCGFNQIVNNLAKMHYRWGHAPKVLIRMPTGGNVGAGPFHSQSTEGWFAHTPGLKILYPSNATDAKGLLLAGLEEPNPVLFFEHKFLYRTNTASVPEDPYLIPIGKANLVRTGSRATVITYGLGVLWAQSLAEEITADIDIIDLRTLAPIDYDTISESVTKTGRVLILHEATLTGGIGAELAAYIGQHYFDLLDAPIIRSASLDTPVPFAKDLETLFLPIERFKQHLLELLSF